jgi:16S rRNA (guanine(527)-N(7))-methyltransferase RsmG
MAAPLPDISREELARRLEAAAPPVEVTPALVGALHAHYQELQRWNPRLSLVGPGAADEIGERHYAEALHGVPLVPAGARTLVDVGSGAGFPGFVLAAALPEVAVTLVEPRERRWSFLMSAARRAALPCRCLNARVDSPLPPGFPAAIDVVTLRALKLPDPAFQALAKRSAPSMRVLIWAGEAEWEAPSGFETALPESDQPLPGSLRRRIVVWRRVAAPESSDPGGSRSPPKVR